MKIFRRLISKIKFLISKRKYIKSFRALVHYTKVFENINRLDYSYNDYIKKYF